MPAPICNLDEGHGYETGKKPFFNEQTGFILEFSNNQPCAAVLSAQGMLAAHPPILKQYKSYMGVAVRMHASRGVGAPLCLQHAFMGGGVE